MPIDIKISKEDMTVSVYKHDELVKSEEITKEEYVGYMQELSGEGIDDIRKMFKLFKPKSITFKEVT